MTRYCTQIEWDDAPHLTEEQKRSLYESIPPHQRDARAKGIPVLGAGQIFPLPEEAVFIDPFKLPDWWPRAYALDPDWARTAALWGAWEREADTVYVYSEYKAGHVPPSIHADAIKRRGEWIIGASDPSIHGKISPKDGEKLFDEYMDLGLNLVMADNAVEAGLSACYQRMAAGRLKIFNTCRSTLSEFRIYRRDEKGKVVKEMDDLMDCLRYLIMTGMMHATTEPMDPDDYNAQTSEYDRSTHTGY